MKSHTAQIVKVSLLVATVVGMVAISNIPGISGNPFVSLIAGVALGILIGKLLKKLNRKLRVKTTN